LSTVRDPVVSGLFYAADRVELIDTIRKCFSHKLGPGEIPPLPEESETRDSLDSDEQQRVECMIVPHAAYVFSGPIAAHSYLMLYRRLFRRLKKGKVIAIILGPNHNGIGSGVAASPDSAWRTPLGDLPVDLSFTKELLTDPETIVDADGVAHSQEHSIEVQLPFLQFVSQNSADLSFVPICLMLQDYETTRQVSDSIVRILEKGEKKGDRRYVILGSSDLTHYEPHETAARKDSKLLGAVSGLDTKEFYSVLQRNAITACGYGAIAVTMNIAKAFRMKKGNILRYATSGDVSGDKTRVVGYPAVHFV
jgi:AmmeMemoRadiSam system protein B